MTNPWENLSLRRRVAILLVFVIAAGAAMLAAVGQNLYDIVQEDHRKELIEAKLNEARTLADMSENVGIWASHYGGMWSRVPKANLFDPSVGSHLDQQCYRTRKPEGGVDEVCFLRKNPALIQREVSDVTEQSTSRAKFRITSDRFTNPNNAPNRFESAALDHVRENNAADYHEIKKTELLYARRIIATPGCLQCHGAKSEAPTVMLARYPLSQGYGYEVGKVIGVTSVRIPLSAAMHSSAVSVETVLSRLGWKSWAGLSLLALAIAWVFFDLSHNIVRNIHRLTAGTMLARDTDLATPVSIPVLARNEHESNNELHRLSHSIKALYESLAIAQHRRVGP